MDARSSFALGSGAYAADRPSYPRELFEWVASMCAGRNCAWDCATGNGQAAIGLAPWFERVEATDLSPAQISHAFTAANVRYSARPAECSGFGDESFDLVAVAQALHWFDLDRYWPEVRRVGRPGAFFCAWGYAWFERTRDLDELYDVYLDPLAARLAGHWSPSLGLLWNGYRADEIAFPFDRVKSPDFAIRLEWEAARLIGYVRTWSAYKAASADPATAATLSDLERAALDRFDGLGPFPLTLPLSVAAGPIA